MSRNKRINVHYMLLLRYQFHSSCGPKIDPMQRTLLNRIVAQIVLLPCQLAMPNDAPRAPCDVLEKPPVLDVFERGP